MRPRSAGASWQAWDRRERRLQGAALLAAWILLTFLSAAAVIGILTIVGFILAILG